MAKDDNQGTDIGQRELQMAARAMIEIFGDDAPNKAIGRAGDYQQNGESGGREFWLRLAEVIQETLDGRTGD